MPLSIFRKLFFVLFIILTLTCVFFVLIGGAMLAFPSVDFIFGYRPLMSSILSLLRAPLFLLLFR